jgi:hypothetical protein
MNPCRGDADLAVVAHVCMTCGVLLYITPADDGSMRDAEGVPLASHGICPPCKAVWDAQMDVESVGGGVDAICRAYRWRVVAARLRHEGWTFPIGVFIGEGPCDTCGNDRCEWRSGGDGVGCDHWESREEDT